MRILINENQNKLLLREFGESVSSWHQWIEAVHKWGDNPSLDHSKYEVIAYGENGEYLGYWDSEQSSGFVVTELIDENVSPEALHDLKSFHNLDETIKLPVEIGDTIFMGKFKNKKVVVKDIDWNEKGDLMINGKSAMRMRIPKKKKVKK